MIERVEVVLVHGLWFGGWSMASLARRLRAAGFGVRQFEYRSTRADLATHAADLLCFVRTISATRVHMLGHSLGGLVILKMLSGMPDIAPGRVVLLGTPLQGSQTVARALQLPGGSALFGQVAVDLCRGQTQFAPGREIGMIAGSRGIGLGRLFGQSARDSDGTVALSETDDPGLSGRLVLPVSHTGMLFSAEVARAVCIFLANGRFGTQTDGA